MDSIETDGAKCRGKIWGEEIGLVGSIAGEYATRSDSNEYGAVLKHSDLAGWCRLHRAPDTEDLVDPRLQDGRDREVVHRRADDNDIGLLDLLDELLGQT